MDKGIKENLNTNSSDYDSLTGVFTREAFCTYADQLLRQNPDVSYNIVISDFVNFKHYNERYGLDAGDLLLRKTGEMISHIDPEIICGRYGSDRFVSIMRNYPDFSVENLQNFQLPPQAEHELPSTNVTVKFGVCRDVDHSIPASVSCDHAYIALQSVKHQYGKNVRIYTDELGNDIIQDVVIEENMKFALTEKQFQVFYQPKMNISDGKIYGAEALVRWVHPSLGFMNPGKFIPLFEKNGFITDMDLYVWEQVCCDIAEWKEKGLDVVPVSSNISRKDFEKNGLADMIIGITDKYGIDHSMFHLEITESMCSEDPESVISSVSYLHDNGFVIELDDFGSGYTSLSSLNDLKLDILKLDMSILRKDVPSSERSVLVFAMQLAKIMGLATIQEGVETAEQLERVRTLGCTGVQGYYFSKPLPKDEYEKFLVSHI